MMPNPFYSKIKFDPEPSRNLFIAGFAYYWSEILEITFREQKSDAKNVALWMELDYGNDRISLSHKKDGTWAEKKVIEKRLVNYVNFAMKIAMGKWDNVSESRNYQLFYDDQSVGEYTSNVFLKKGDYTIVKGSKYFFLKYIYWDNVKLTLKLPSPMDTGNSISVWAQIPKDADRFSIVLYETDKRSFKTVLFKTTLSGALHLVPGKLLTAVVYNEGNGVYVYVGYNDYVYEAFYKTNGKAAVYAHVTGSSISGIEIPDCTNSQQP
ncbi:hypothetical protein AB6A40_009367 [Gnathostoma spinigerum]|uniref:Uncharacterized protein n=1 Tax=Gnathostoma spinigerum TaxID=75299 RepID=A0ABD6ERT6_9BILA